MHASWPSETVVRGPGRTWSGGTGGERSGDGVCTTSCPSAVKAGLSGSEALPASSWRLTSACCCRTAGHTRGAELTSYFQTRLELNSDGL